MMHGRCDCGKIDFTVAEVRSTVTICHCTRCRRASGHYWASTKAPWADLSFASDEGLTWYASSDIADRGFCRFCGSSVFFRVRGDAGVGIAAGCLDTPTGLETGKHIFVADKGDYYPLPDDGAPRIPD